MLAWIWFNIIGCVICSYIFILGKYQLIRVESAVETTPNQWESGPRPLWGSGPVRVLARAGNPRSTILKTRGLLPKRFICLTGIQEIYLTPDSSAQEDLGSRQCWGPHSRDFLCSWSVQPLRRQTDAVLLPPSAVRCRKQHTPRRAPYPDTQNNFFISFFCLWPGPREGWEGRDA